MNNIDYVESLENIYKNAHKTVIDMRTSSRARIVWNVGISGFALLNAKSYWDAIAGKPITGINIAMLSLPWALSTFLGVIAYFLIDETIKKDEIFFNSIIMDFDFFKMDLMKNGMDAKELQRINKAETPSTNLAMKKMIVWRNWSRWFELLTFASLVAGFIWSVIGPLLLE